MSRRFSSMILASSVALGTLVAALGATGCGGSVRGETADPTSAGANSVNSTEYSVSARQNYERGMKRLEDDDHAEAAKFFAFVKARFPYSKYAVLAELRLADTLFATTAYLEAIDGYKQFIKFHPSHEM